MRKSRLSKRSQTPLAKAKKILWKAIKDLINIRDGTICISCGSDNLVGYNKQGGHFIPSASCGGFLRYDIRNVHIQCATCNLFRGGAGAEYTRALEKKYSTSFVDKIIADKQTTIKLDLDYINKLTEYYHSLLLKSKEQLLKITKNYNGFHIN